MSTILKTALKAGSAVIGTATLLVTNSVLATQNGDPTTVLETTDMNLELADSSLANTYNNDELLQQINQYNQKTNSLEQVTNVNQLRDVSPGDWAYEALRNLVETYGCIAGYPDGTYRGNRAMTRYEFAAGLNACLQQIERLIAAATADFVTKEDLAVLQRLMEEFEAELATLGTRVDNLEGRVTFLEDHQFSTTTKLNGEVITYILGTFGDEKPDGSDVDDQITFGSRARLNFDTSFTGRDRLRTRIQASNITSPASAGGSNSLFLNLEGDSDNNFELKKLIYSFPITDNIVGHVGTKDVLIDDVFDAGSTSGLIYDSLSLFSAYNNLVYDNSNAGGAGVGVNVDLGGVMLDAGYWVPTSDAQSPADGDGIFNGNFATGAQLGFKLFDERFDVAVNYLYSYQTADSGYDLAGFVGTTAATDPFDEETNRSHHLGTSTKLQLSDTIAIGGYFGYVFADSIDSDKSADILNWNAFLTIADLMKEGSAFVVSFGQPPTAVDGEDGAEDDDDTPYLLDVEYRFNLTDNINIAPGGYILFNPDGDSDNDTIFVGTVRTIFSF